MSLTLIDAMFAKSTPISFHRCSGSGLRERGRGSRCAWEQLEVIEFDVRVLAAAPTQGNCCEAVGTCGQRLVSGNRLGAKLYARVAPARRGASATGVARHHQGTGRGSVELDSGPKPVTVNADRLRRVKARTARRAACRFAEGMDPGFSKPFPPEFPRLTAR
jgi:hypothetical protein